MAVREIKTSITLDGEQQFRQAIAAANKELRVSQSELKAVASAYDLSGDRMTMLANKQRSLGDMVNQQENITNALRRNLKELEQAYERAGRGVEEYRDKLRQAETSGNEQEIESATKALRQAEAAYERAGQKVADYRIQVNNAEDKLNKFKRSAQDVDREIEELGRDSVKAGRQIEDGIGDSAEAAEKDVRGLVKVLQDDLSSIRASTTFTAIGSLWDMATDAYSSVSSFVEGTTEYRRQLSYLELNASQAGWGMEETTAKLYEVQAMTGEASSAIEGLSNLLMVGIPKDNQFTRVMEALLGATVKLPDTVNFEGLAEGFRETIATGEAAGQMVNMLEQIWGSDAIEKINSALKESATLEGDIEAVLAVLEGDGQLGEAYAQYRKENEDLIKELETIARLEYQSARVGAIISRNITTPIKSSFADTLVWLADEMTKFEADPEGYVANALSKGIEGTVDILMNGIESEAGEMVGNAAKGAATAVARTGSKAFAIAFGADEETQENISEAAESFVEDATQAIGGGMKWLNNNLNLLKIAKNISDTAAGERTAEDVLKDLNPWDEQYTGIKERPTGLTKGKGLWVPDESSKTYMRFLGEALKENGGNMDLAKARAWIETTFTTSNTNPIRINPFDRALYAKYTAEKAITGFMDNWVSPEKAEEAGEEVATSFLDGWDTMIIRPDLAQEAEGFLTDEQGNAIKPIGIRENWEEYLKTITDMVPQYEEAGEEAGAATAKAFGAELDAAAAQAKLAGATAALNFGAGLSSQVSYVAAQAGVLAAAASARLSSSRGGGTVNVALNIDGRQVATALAPYNDEVMAVTFDGTTPFRMR